MDLIVRRMTLKENNKLKIFIGWDSREDIAYQIARYSITKLASVPVEIIPLKQKELKNNKIYWRDEDKLASTEFTFTRFLVPELMNFNGWALFIDCDFVALEDVKKLFDLKKDKYAVMCCHHDYTPKNFTKMDGQAQHAYPRKNWSSMMLINCSHPSNKKLTKDLVNDPKTDGKYLHRFSWLRDDEIGTITHEWNWLVGWYKEPQDGKPKFLHYTEGGPWFEKYENCEYSREWYKSQAEYYASIIESKNKTMITIDDLPFPDHLKKHLANEINLTIDPSGSFKRIERNLSMTKPVRVGVLHNTDYEQHKTNIDFDPILESVAIGNRGVLISWDKAKDLGLPLVIRGLASDSQRALKWCKEKDIDFYFIDTGYLQPNIKKEYHRLTKNNLQNLGPLIERPFDRLKLLKWKYRKSKQGSKILICPPSHKVMKYYDQDLDSWMEKLISEIKQYTDRPIDIRLKPSRTERTTTNTIWNALDDAYCLVTYNSIAATEALLHSVPAIALAPNAASILCNTKISELESLKIPSKEELEAFAAHLSYCQFTQQELQSGFAMQIVNENQ